MVDPKEFVLEWGEGMWYVGDAGDGSPRWESRRERAHRFPTYMEAVEFAHRLRQDGYRVRVVGVG
jgi:hypothetical protein